MTFDLLSVLAYWPSFASGFVLTLWVSVAAAIIGLIIASLLVLCQILGRGLGRVLTGTWLAVMRGAPFIALVYSIHMLLPLTGWRPAPVASGLIALSAFCSAYYAEVIRAAIQSLPTGQWESARVMGMSRTQAARHVIIPQLWKPALPSLIGNTMTMIKESSVLSVLTVAELTYQGLVIQGKTFAPFEVFIITATLYWLLTLGLILLARGCEKRWLSPSAEDVKLSPIGHKFLSLRR